MKLFQAIASASSGIKINEYDTWICSNTFMGLEMSWCHLQAVNGPLHSTVDDAEHKLGNQAPHGNNQKQIGFFEAKYSRRSGWPAAW